MRAAKSVFSILDHDQHVQIIHSPLRRQPGITANFSGYLLIDVAKVPQLYAPPPDGALEMLFLDGAHRHPCSLNMIKMRMGNRHHRYLGLAQTVPATKQRM